MSSPAVIHGWRVFAHPLFTHQLEALSRKVDVLKKKDPTGYSNKNSTKLLRAIVDLAFDIIPQDPTHTKYRLGHTLGEEYKHWFRAKFYQQYRLFFRFHAPSKILVYAWVNDEMTKRAYESDDDAYKVFKKMIKKGNPPDDWDSLLAASRKLET